MGKNRAGGQLMTVLTFSSLTLKILALALHQLPVANIILCNKTPQLVV